jgi:hypothetical protein
VRWLAALPLLLAVVSVAAADDKKDESGFLPMFNGRDLTGWVNVNCAPSTFFVKDREIITTGHPTGYLRTARQYENFIAEFDWMHVPSKPGAVSNSGFFVWADPIPAVGTGYTRGIEVQVLVNLTYRNRKGEITATSQGDLFSIHGAMCVPDRPHPDGWARCLPSANYCKGEREWNHYRVVGNNGRLTLAVNGHVVSGLSKCNPRTGYLALESEGSECHFRNLRIKELPGTNPKPGEVVDVGRGFKSLYTGLDLSGWKGDEGAKKRWQPHDTVLHYDGKGAAKDDGLRTEKEFGDAEFLVDFRFPRKAGKPAACGFVLREAKEGGILLLFKPNGTFEYQYRYDGDLLDASVVPVKVKSFKPGQWNRLGVTLKDKWWGVSINGKVVEQEKKVAPPKITFELSPQGEVDFANLFVRKPK